MEKIILFIACIIAVAADMSWVWWAKSKEHNIWILIIGFILSMTSLVFWIYSLIKGITAAQAITIYSIFTIIGCSFLGIVIFKEAITVINGIGLIFALIALIMISI